MKGLRLFLPPFAPDTAGAASLLYPLGGMVIIIDAGGCAGNICGFDEPRWETAGIRSAVFSAALRDMDAIMGRDDKLVEKVSRAAREIHANFIALVGTPVPAVIGTDYRALCRMLEKRVGIPSIAIDADGTHDYDKGIEKAYLALLKSKVHAFASSPNKPASDTAGVLGVTPLDFSSEEKAEIKSFLQTHEYNRVTFYEAYADFTGDVLPCVNFVASPSGLCAAKFMQKHWNIPFHLLQDALLDKETLLKTAQLASAKNILVLHHMLKASAVRIALRRTHPDANITIGSWFLADTALMEEGDLLLKEESAFIDVVKERGFDAILGDDLLKRALHDYAGTFLPLHHFAVSGAEEFS